MTDTALSQQLVVFSLGREEYALPITRVHEIIRYSEPRAVASDVPSIRGVISLRGKIVCVHDLATRLGLAPSASGQAKIVIVDTGGDLAGVVVDEVEEVLSVEAEQLDAVPGTQDGCIDGVAKIGDRLVIILNPDGMLEGADAAVLAAA
jgi:purine-binding chemotaxis protein CheW